MCCRLGYRCRDCISQLSDGCIDLTTQASLAQQKKQFISWTRNMVAELRCKQLVSSGCWFECWHGLLASQPFLFVAPIFVWFPICWCSNVSHGRHGNKKNNRDRKPHRRAGSEHCLRTRGKVWCRAARDGPAAEVVQDPVYPGANSVIRADRREGPGEARQARRTILRRVQRLGAGHVAVHKKLTNKRRPTGATKT